MKTISTKTGNNLERIKTEKKLMPTASAMLRERVDFFFTRGILEAVNPPCDPCGCRAFLLP